MTHFTSTPTRIRGQAVVRVMDDVTTPLRVLEMLHPSLTSNKPKSHILCRP